MRVNPRTQYMKQKRAMLYRVSRNFLPLLIIFHYSCTIGYTLLTKDNDKLTENTALQMCIDSFDIHKDKIIRTQDSQGMGAKYLTEADLDSRQDCLRLCCETDECDVFIFEEVKPGSCYLFHCGPPHDFKCKFTNHANYSSAVLTNINYRSTAQLEEQIRRTQQEHELKSLRKSAEPAPLEYSYTETPPIPPTQPPTSLVLTTPVPIKTDCSRNQYKCRTSGDCIAIYNVCDGIPQCTDGSDEASELGCPTERPTLPSAPVIHVPLVPQSSQVLKYPPILPHRKIYPPLYANEQENPTKLWQLPVSPHQMINQPQQPIVQYPGQQGVIPQMNYGSQGYIGGWDYRQIYEQNKEAYNAADQLHPKNELPSYEQDQPRIFKHKNAGVVAQGVGPDGNTYIDANRPYGPYYPLQNHAAWQEGQPQIPSQHPDPVPSFSSKSQQNRSATTQEQPKSTTGPEPCKSSSKKVIDSPKEKNDEHKENETQKTSHVEATKNRDHSTKSNPRKTSQQELRIETKVEKAEDRDEQHKKNHEEHKTEVRRHHYVVEHLQQNNHKSDYDILRPKGAVISLALGLTATAIMAALIACRLRVVRRRGRRGHGPYAHDADYLVNGMYL